MTQPRKIYMSKKKVGESYEIIVFVGRKWSNIGNLIKIYKNSLLVVIMFT